MVMKKGEFMKQILMCLAQIFSGQKKLSKVIKWLWLPTRRMKTHNVKSFRAIICPMHLIKVTQFILYRIFALFLPHGYGHVSHFWIHMKAVHSCSYHLFCTCTIYPWCQWKISVHELKTNYASHTSCAQFCCWCSWCCRYLQLVLYQYLNQQMLNSLIAEETDTAVPSVLYVVH